MLLRSPVCCTAWRAQHAPAATVSVAVPLQLRKLLLQGFILLLQLVHAQLPAAGLRRLGGTPACTSCWYG
jgi:hypothetical protein